MNDPFVLGLDLDGVCADYVRGFGEFVAGKRGIQRSDLPAPTHWSFAKSGWCESEEQYVAWHTEAVRRGLFRWMEPIEGCSEALWRLSDAGVYIRVVTHRLGFKGLHRNAASDTIEWLDLHDVPYRDICFVANKPQIDADIYIDDAPHNLNQLSNAGGEVICFDASYNRELDMPRAIDWDQAADMVLEHKDRLGK